MRLAAGVLALSVALVAACSADPRARLREDAAALIEAANDRDADRVRALAEAFAASVEAEAASGDLPQDEAERLSALAAAVLAGADAIDEDLLERRRAEAEAEAARRELEETRRQLEEERRRAEEQAEGDKGEGEGDKDEGRGKGRDDEEKPDD